MVRQELQNNPSYAALNPTQQITASANAVTQFTGSFSASFGVPIATSTPTVQVFYGGILSSIQSARDKLQGWFLAAWGLIVFLIFRIVGIIVVWFTQFIALIVYEVLLSAGFMRVVQHPDVKEEVEY